MNPPQVEGSGWGTHVYLWRLLISWLQSPSVVILEPRKIKSDTVSTVAPSISHSGGTGCHDLRFLNVEL